MSSFSVSPSAARPLGAFMRIYSQGTQQIDTTACLNVKKCQMYASRLKHIFLEEPVVGLWEEMCFQSNSEQSMTDGGWVQVCWKRVPDGWSCNVEALSTELNLGPWNRHDVSLSWIEVPRPDRHTDMVEVGRTSAVDRVKGSVRHLQQYPQTYQHFYTLAPVHATYFQTSVMSSILFWMQELLEDFLFNELVCLRVSFISELTTDNCLIQAVGYSVIHCL